MSARINTLLNGLATVSLVESMIDEFIDRDLPVMVYYTLRRAGIPIVPGDDISMATITRVISEKTGVQFRDLTNLEMVKQDVEAHAARQIYEATGIDLDNLDRTSVIRKMRDVMIDVAANRAPGALAVVAFGKEMQHVAKDAYREGGLDRIPRKWEAHLQRWNHREAQRRYGARHAEVWSVEDLGAVRGGRFRYVIREKKLRAWWRWNNKWSWRPRIAGKFWEYPKVVTGPARKLDNGRWAINRQVMSRTELHRRRKKHYNSPNIDKGPNINGGGTGKRKPRP